MKLLATAALAALVAGLAAPASAEPQRYSVIFGGKVVGHLLGVPTTAARIVVAGQLAAATGPGILGIGLTDLAGSAAAAMAEPARWLIEAGRQAAGSVR